MFLAYTNCENGYRHFTHLHGVDVSYDKKFIDHLIQERSVQTKALKDHVQFTEAQVAMAKEHADLPPHLDFVMDHNRKVVLEQMSWLKRLSTAEAALNGELVRDVMFFPDVQMAIAYTLGTPCSTPT